MASQDELKAQLKELMAIPENMHCVDCDDKRPTWASLIVPPPDAAFTEPIGCFCCYHCSGAHRRMGTHICFVRSTNLDEWKPKELEAMKNGGNAVINKVFEAKLSDEQKAVARPDKHTELDPRSSYIYDKYQHRKWYDSTLARRKSTFVPPTPIGDTASNGQATRSSGGAFDDFFALRTKDAHHDSWHDDSKDNSNEIHFDPNENFLEPKSIPKADRANIMDSLQRMNSQRVMRSIEDLGENPKAMGQRKSDGFKDMNNSISEQSAFMIKDDDPFQPKSPAMAHSARGGLSFTGTPKADGRQNLMSTLQRMDSKREVLNTIRDIGGGEEEGNGVILPRKVALANRRKNRLGEEVDSRRRGSGDAEQDTPRKRGSNDGDARPRIKRTGSSEKEDNGSGPGRRAPARTKSSSSEDGVGIPRRGRVRRTASGDGQGREERSALKDSSHTSLKESSHTTTSTASRSRRDPKRGVARTKSMDSDTEQIVPRRRHRSKSAKRGVRRSASNDEVLFHGSLEGSLFGDAEGGSQVSGRSTARRPPRRPGKSVEDEEKQSDAKQMDESLSSRHSRHDDSKRNRRRERPDESNSRTPSPSGGAPSGASRSNSRRRNKSVPRKPQSNAINVSRVPTVRDRKPRSPRSLKSPACVTESPVPRQRTADVPVADDM